jgi:hypothetical protein
MLRTSNTRSYEFTVLNIEFTVSRHEFTASNLRMVKKDEFFFFSLLLFLRFYFTLTKPYITNIKYTKSQYRV